MFSLRQAELVCSGGHKLMLQGVTARGAINGRLLDMSLQQRFHNAGDTNAEITYTFPLPYGAALMGVDVEINGKPLVGQVTSRSNARETYEQALSEGNSSIMLERNRDHSYTLELGNLMGGESCAITIRYAHLLQLEHGQIRLMLPTTLAPRFGNPITQGGLQPHQVPVADITVEYPFDISITLHGGLARANVASPSHKTGYSYHGDDVEVRLAQRGALDRDFILTLSELPSQSAAIASVDTFTPGQTALMASFNPDFGERSPKPVVAKILVDCSLSMQGDSIDAARSALHRIVAGMESADRFSLSRFGSTVEHRCKGLWHGTELAKLSAKRWVNALRADLSGTEIAAALTSTIAIAHEGQSDILMITDGETYAIDEVIEVAMRSGHRVFVVGIGASPAEANLRRLAVHTDGACDFVAPGEDVEPVVLRMFSRLRASRARNLRVEWPQGVVPRWSQTVPTYAFSDDALLVSAFAESFTTNEDRQVRLWGCLDDAQEETLLARTDINLAENSANTLARMVALARHSQMKNGQKTLVETDALSAQELAVQYQLVTDETNFILVHERAENEKALEMPEANQVPQMLAAGWGGTGSVRRSRSMMIQPDYCELDIGNDDQFLMAHSSMVPRRSASSADLHEDFCTFAQFPIAQTDSTTSADLMQSRYPSDPDNSVMSPAMLCDWLTIYGSTQWLNTYTSLRGLGLGQVICEWLEFEIGFGKDEALVVRAFIAVLLSFGFGSDPVQADLPQPPEDPLSTTIRTGLQGLTADDWPDAVRNYSQKVVI